MSRAKLDPVSDVFHRYISLTPEQLIRFEAMVSGFNLRMEREKQPQERRTPRPGRPPGSKNKARLTNGQQAVMAALDEPPWDSPRDKAEERP